MFSAVKLLHRNFQYIARINSTLKKLNQSRSFHHTASRFEDHVSLQNLTPRPRKKKKQKGRGGKTSRGGRGNKGMGHHGSTIPRGFEGGQTPLQLTTPKIKIAQPHPDVPWYTKVSLEYLQYLCNIGRLDPTKTITMRHLYQAGVNLDMRRQARITEVGWKFFTTPIKIRCSQFTPEAIKRIEEVGGNVTSVFYSVREMRILLEPHLIKGVTERFKAPESLLHKKYYFSWENRGYLSPPKLAELILDSEFIKWHILVRPTKNFILQSPALTKEYEELGVDLNSLPRAVQYYQDQMVILEKILIGDYSEKLDSSVTKFLVKMTNVPFDRLSLHPLIEQFYRSE